MELDATAPEELPAPMQAMSAAERKALIAETGKRRKGLKHQMKELADQRATYLRDKVEASGAAKGSLDESIFRAVREQAKPAGLEYEAAAPAY